LWHTKTIEESPPAYLARVGHVFAVFGEKTQDSGNISYGVQVGKDRFFVKTAGDPPMVSRYLYPE
jgi:serine/threonine-protein kinase